MKYIKHIKLFESTTDKINDVKDILLDIKDMGYVVNYSVRRRDDDSLIYNFSIDNIDKGDDIDDIMDDDSVYSFALPLSLAKPVHFESEFLETINRVRRYLGNKTIIIVSGQFGAPNKNNQISYKEQWLPLDFITDESNRVCGIWHMLQIEFSV